MLWRFKCCRRCIFLRHRKWIASVRMIVWAHTSKFVVRGSDARTLWAMSMQQHWEQLTVMRKPMRLAPNVQSRKFYYWVVSYSMTITCLFYGRLGMHCCRPKVSHHPRKIFDRVVFLFHHDALLGCAEHSWWSIFKKKKMVVETKYKRRAMHEPSRSWAMKNILNSSNAACSKLNMHKIYWASGLRRQPANLNTFWVCAGKPEIFRSNCSSN